MCILFHADAVGTDGTLYHLQASMEAAQYESLGRADDALLVKMLDAGLVKLKAGNHCAFQHLRHTKLSTQIATGARIAVDNGLRSPSASRYVGVQISIMGFDEWNVCHCAVECRAGDIIRDEVVGKGTSAEVYKLILSSGQTLAIKRCDLSCNLIMFNGVDTSTCTPDGLSEHVRRLVEGHLTIQQ